MIRKWIFSLMVSAGMLTAARCQQPQTAVRCNLQIDGSIKFQELDGLGVNANTRSWNGNDLKPALNLLLDSLQARVWRVIVETVYNWEDKNDDNDPFHFNWDYYNALYETPKFQKAWSMIRYLNRHGIRNNLMINFMGPIPLWMGGKVVKPKYEDEYIEMLVSFFVYARNVEHLKIGLISIMNEPDIENEGPTVGGEQYARLLRKFIDRMVSLGMGDIKYVAPDVAGMGNGLKDYIPVLMKDPVIMSKLSHFGLHSYAGYYAPVDSSLKQSPYPNSSFWMTEWNAWRNGLDDGKIGVYDYKFASECISHLLDLLNNGATAAIEWEAYDSYYEHHAPSVFSYWGILGYNPDNRHYTPRKHFYTLSQLFDFVKPGAYRISVSKPVDGLKTIAFLDSIGTMTLVGVSNLDHPIALQGALNHLPGITQCEMYHTTATENLVKDEDIVISSGQFRASIPAHSIFTITGYATNRRGAVSGRPRPEPADWYTGDIHVHRNCGDGTAVLDEKRFADLMVPNNLDVISVLADMGNGEVKYSAEDLLKVSGKDAALSQPGRIVHWDAEWHWDATYSNFGHQALGGHLVLLGLKNAHQIWDESDYKILDWGRKQGAISGFAHFEYLKDTFQNDLNCCIPIEYPVEAALGTIDFVSEDVFGSGSPNNGNYNSEAAIHAYYKLLNCGFRLGLAAGTDFPCNESEPLGTLLTYVQVKKGLTYDKWIRGIKEGRTVVSRNAHNEFIELKADGNHEPGDEIKIKNGKRVSLSVRWTGLIALSGSVELVCNVKVIASQAATVSPGKPFVFNTTHEITESSWICARRMDENGHETHTAPIYFIVNKKPVRASAEDAQFFINWIDKLLEKTSPGGPWNRYFTHDLDTVQGRYKKAKNIYIKVLQECRAAEKTRN
jgi:O-glycosyl hydrolase